MPRLSVGAMSALSRDIIAATMTNLGTGEFLCTEIFPIADDQIARLRVFLRRRLEGHPACGTAVLLAGELATNSVRHSGSRFFVVTVTRLEGSALRVAVIDEGRTGFPLLKDESLDSESGRGMAIVDMLAKRWGITRKAGVGIAVWFECAS
jgi:anti-sigma regulatory factor (Ser/Thr protein kinase)